VDEISNIVVCTNAFFQLLLFLILLVAMHMMALCCVSFFIVSYVCHFSEITLIFSYNSLGGCVLHSIVMRQNACEKL
jgi:hypothetical protein